MTAAAFLRSGGFACVAIAVLVAVGCGRREPSYDTSSPERALDAATEMVRDGRAERLPDLIYADTPAMRQALRRLGRLMDRMERTAKVVSGAFPGEAAAAQEEATDGAITFLRDSIRGSRDPAVEAYDALGALMADPFGWLGSQRERVSIIPIGDETAGVLWDGKMVLPPFGLAMRRASDDVEVDDRGRPVNTPGGWHLVAPLNVPVVSRFAPRTDDQWLIVSMLFRAWENVLIDIERRIESGEIRSLEQASREAGRMLLAPTLGVWIAYGSTLRSDG